MKRSTKIAVAMAASLGLGAAVAAALAHPGGMGPGMRHGMGPGGMAGGPMAAGVQHDVNQAHIGLERKTTVETTQKGSVLVQTSDDPKVVAALQAHAMEVSELARDGMAAMMRAAQARAQAR